MPHLSNATKFELRGKPVYAGPAPWTFENSSAGMKPLYDAPWTIDHPDAQGKLWRICAIERHCVMKIFEGQPISIMIAGEWSAEEQKP